MDAIDEVKSRLSIEDVVSEYIELKRAGRNYKGLSPFSNERTPSFMVSPEKQIWHDFSSGKGGNIFSFVMEMEGLDFKGTLELLARKAGVDLSQYRSAGAASNAKRKNRLYDCLDLAAKFYQVHFSKTKDAYEYILGKRGYSKDTALAFRVGYAPVNGNALLHFLKSKGYSEEEIKQAGLSTVRRGSPSDMFRGRIMIPLMDAQGRVVGFTARLLHDDPNAPKYINTPQTLLYDKSRHVFGLHLAKEAIRKEDFVVAVEGNLDVIASYQAGVRNVVATAGTAMTQYHLKELSRFTHDVRLAFDQDSAGLAATERTIVLASSLNIALNIITVPSGKDPDELIKQDSKAWLKAIQSPQYALDWLVERYSAEFDIQSALGKKALSNKIMPIIRSLHDKVEKEHYVNTIADLLGVSTTALSPSANAAKTLPKKRHKEVEKITPAAAEITKAQNQLLALCLTEPSLRQRLAYIQPEMMYSVSANTALTFLQKHPKEAIHPDKSLPADLQSEADYVKILILLYEELYSHLEFIELQYEAARLQVRVIEQYVKTQKAALAHDLHDADDRQAMQLLQKVKEFDELLRDVKRSTVDGK